jgi:hypothetical protein
VDFPASEVVPCTISVLEAVMSSPVESGIALYCLALIIGNKGFLNAETFFCAAAHQCVDFALSGDC